jgi:hypothetical protein
MARTRIDLSYEHRLEQALGLCDHLLASLPVSDFQIEKGGGGNWDDNAIEAISARIGFQLRVSQQTYSAIKKHFKEELGPLALIKRLRNRLAHGEISFAECGEGATVTELRDLKEKTANYLREVVAAFDTYIDEFEFLHPDSRPARVA